MCSNSDSGKCRCRHARIEGFIQPCLLLLLAESRSYGYELMEKLGKLGWKDVSPDPGAVYRNLRRMEADGLVESTWDTTGTGPARRLYHLTPEGEDFLSSWAVRIEQNVKLLERFLKRYRDVSASGPSGAEG